MATVRRGQRTRAANPHNWQLLRRWRLRWVDRRGGIAYIDIVRYHISCMHDLGNSLDASEGPGVYGDSFRGCTVFGIGAWRDNQFRGPGIRCTQT